MTEHEDNLTGLAQVDEALVHLRLRAVNARERAVAGAMDRVAGTDLLMHRVRRWNVAKQFLAYSACAAGVGLMVSAGWMMGSPATPRNPAISGGATPVGVVAVARIRDEAYVSLEDAIDAAQPNDTIHVIQSSISGGLRISKPMVLVGNGRDALSPS